VLRGTGRWFSEIFAQYADPILKGQTISLDCPTLEDGTEILSRKVSENRRPSPRNVSAERNPPVITTFTEVRKCWRVSTRQNGFTIQARITSIFIALKISNIIQFLDVEFLLQKSCEISPCSQIGVCTCDRHLWYESVNIRQGPV
jgi:hypothetical protein